LLETRRRLDDIAQSLRQELDAGAPDPWYLAHRSRGVGHVLRSFAGQVVFTLALAEVAEAHDAADLYRPVVAAWQQVERATASMDLVGEQVLDAAAVVREQESNPQPAVRLNAEIERPLDRDLDALREMAYPTTKVFDPQLIPSLRKQHVAARQSVKLIYEELKRGVDEARGVGEAPELAVLGASLRALRHAQPVTSGLRSDPGLKDVALTSLTRAMRAVQEAQASAG